MTMKKLIRKILRESHDMDWVEDTNLSPYHGVKFTVSRRDYGHPLCSYFILYDAAISDSHTGVNKELVNKPRATYGESYYVYCDYEGNEEPTANGLKGLSMYSKEGIDDQFDKGNWIRVDNVIDGDLNEVKKILKEDDFDESDVQWMEDVEPMPLGPHGDAKRGEKLICLPGFHGEIKWVKRGGSDSYGGAGYVDGKIIIVEHVSKHKDRNVVWPLYSSIKEYGGIFANALARL